MQEAGNAKEETKRSGYLFIGKDEKNSVPQLVFSQHPHQFLPSFVDPLAVIAVHHKDQTCRKR